MWWSKTWSRLQCCDLGIFGIDFETTFPMLNGLKMRKWKSLRLTLRAWRARIRFWMFLGCLGIRRRGMFDVWFRVGLSKHFRSLQWKGLNMVEICQAAGWCFVFCYPQPPKFHPRRFPPLILATTKRPKRPRRSGRAASEVRCLRAWGWHRMTSWSKNYKELKPSRLQYYNRMSEDFVKTVLLA